ncbi:glycoside hydrolase family 23 protein [Mycena floridula]|nr:glycoside hydrolase family 23 protein [Mycena floridula]
MKVVSLVLATLWASNIAVAGRSRGFEALARHARVSRLPAGEVSIVKRTRCKAKTTAKKVVTTGKSSNSTSSLTKTASKSSTYKATTSKSKSGSSSGVINVKSSCGNIGATKKSTATSGPNGSLGWLNCGIDGSGWKPPYISVNDIIAVDLDDALKDPKSPYKQCSEYVWIFIKYGHANGIPPILLAAFALQESSCRPETVGGGGEQGIMQISKDKCGGAPGGNCRDPEFNIRTAAKYFKGQLEGFGNNIVEAIGSYNGWRSGLTYAQATAARHTSCCRCQNNLDYIHQFLNGWLQNVDAYSSKLGKYFNLNVCGGDDS